MASEKQRQQSRVNWTLAEKEFLLSLIVGYAAILRQGKGDYNCNQRKIKAWEAMHNKFCCRFGQMRDLKSMKDAFKRMKMAAKGEYSAYASEVNRTGGGPPPPEPSEMAVLIKDLFPTEFTQIVNPFDDDADDKNSDAVTVLEFLSGTTAIATAPVMPASAPVFGYVHKHVERRP